MSVTRYTASSILRPLRPCLIRFGAHPFIQGAMTHTIRKSVSFSGSEVKSFICDIREEQLARGRRQIVDIKLGMDGLIRTKPSKIRQEDPLAASPFINVHVKPTVDTQMKKFYRNFHSINLFPVESNEVKCMKQVMAKRFSEDQIMNSNPEHLMKKMIQFYNYWKDTHEINQTFTKPRLARTQPNRFNYCDN